MLIGGNSLKGHLMLLTFFFHSLKGHLMLLTFFFHSAGIAFIREFNFNKFIFSCNFNFISGLNPI